MLKSLLYVRFKSFFSGLVGKSKDGKISPLRIIGMTILMAILALSFLVIIISMCAPLALLLAPEGLSAAYYGFINLITFSIIFIFSIFETKSELFDCKDNELLLSMPIRPLDIVISRSMTLLIINAGEALYIMVPASVIFTIFGGNAWYIASSSVVAVLISVLATVLSSAVGYLVAMIAKKFKNNSFIPLMASLVFLFAYFFGYSAFMEMLMTMEETDPEVILEMLSGVLEPISFFGKMSLFDPLYIIGFTLIVIGATALAWMILSKSYIGIITTSYNTKGREYKREELKSAPVFLALARKEFAALLSSANYMLNSGIGIIFEVLIAVFVLISREEIILTLNMLTMELAIPTEGLAALLAVVLMIFVSSTNCMSASALSLEGKRFWIVRSAPVSADALIYAKLAPHVLISAVATLVTSVILGIALSVSPLEWVFLLVTPQVASLAGALLGLIYNIIWPKFDFENEVQVVKQSLPVFLCVLTPMILLVPAIFAGIFLFLTLGALITEIIVLAVFVVLFLILYLLLMGPAARRLDKLKP